MRGLNTSSSEATFEAGLAFGKTLHPNAVVAFFGDLGAGKTTFIKGVVSAFSTETVTSPTFTYLHIYSGGLPIYHFDLYRIKGASDFKDLGFAEYFTADGICLIEWSEKIDSILPKQTLRIRLEHRGGDCRAISIDA
jgi:tRNA threonylcarbamoyladenosine biosynthesis protein TsaE